MLVGVRGFEPPAPASRKQCSTRLSYTPAPRDIARSAHYRKAWRAAPCALEEAEEAPADGGISVAAAGRHRFEHSRRLKALCGAVACVEVKAAGATFREFGLIELQTLQGEMRHQNHIAGRQRIGRSRRVLLGAVMAFGWHSCRSRNRPRRADAVVGSAKRAIERVRPRAIKPRRDESRCIDRADLVPSNCDRSVWL